jgi:hypothetical protein
MLRMALLLGSLDDETEMAGDKPLRPQRIEPRIEEGFVVVHEQFRCRCGWDGGAGRVSSLEYLVKCYGMACARPSEAWQISVNRCKERVGDERPNDHNPRIIEETRQYIGDFDRIAWDGDGASAVRSDACPAPGRVNPGALRGSARNQGLTFQYQTPFMH